MNRCAIPIIKSIYEYITMRLSFERREGVFSESKGEKKVGEKTIALQKKRNVINGFDRGKYAT